MMLDEAVTRRAVLEDVSRERDRQEKIHGPQSLIRMGAAFGFPVLLEELGEASSAFLERKPDEYRKELVQVAAVAVAMIQAHDMREHIARTGGS